MALADNYNIDTSRFWRDPYPDLARMRAQAPIAVVPQLGATLITKRADIVECERNVAVFSSEQPQGLMTRLMGENMMRKDGHRHFTERRIYNTAIAPKIVKAVWKAEFLRHARSILDTLSQHSAADIVNAYAMPLSAQALMVLTGLTNIDYRQIDEWSQAMIDGIANYGGDPKVERRCRLATAAIDAAIDDMLPVVRKHPNQSLLSVMSAAGMNEENIRANIKLTISGGQNEPRDAIAGCVWALLTHRDQLAMVHAGQASWLDVFEEYCRWISPIGMSPRQVANRHCYRDVEFETGDRVFFMFSSANRDEDHFADADRFDIRRDNNDAIHFGAGPHFCAGAAASRTLVAEVALPEIFNRLDDLHLTDAGRVQFRGWAFRGPLRVDAAWTPRH